MRSVLNFAAFQIGWFAAVLGAGHSMPWLGVVIVPLVLLVNLAFSADRRQGAGSALVAAVMRVRGRYGPGGRRQFSPSALFGAATVQPLLDGHAWVNQATNPEWVHVMVAWTLFWRDPFRRSWGASRLSQRCEAWRSDPAFDEWPSSSSNPGHVLFRALLAAAEFVRRRLAAHAA